jgi:hypothetical protein
VPACKLIVGCLLLSPGLPARTAMVAWNVSWPRLADEAR